MGVRINGGGNIPGRIDKEDSKNEVGSWYVVFVNVWIQGFDDAKVESNKVASTNIQRLSIVSSIIQGQANKIKKKIRPQKSH